MTTIPKALAETPELLHEAQKSTLADTIWSAVNQNAVSIPDVRFVLDGGALLHRIPWSQGASYESILETYSKYVATNFGKAVVVFDGYKELQPSIWLISAVWREKKELALATTFSLDMNLTVTKEAFLSDPKNKQFIDFLGTKLTNQGCQVFNDQADADLLIVQETIKSASSMDTILIGDDTNLLVLLLHHLP